MCYLIYFRNRDPEPVTSYEYNDCYLEFETATAKYLYLHNSSVRGFYKYFKTLDAYIKIDDIDMVTIPDLKFSNTTHIFYSR